MFEMTTRSKISRIRLAALSLLAMTLAIGALIVHSLSANVYYNLNMIRLQNGGRYRRDRGSTLSARPTARGGPGGCCVREDEWRQAF